MHISQIVASIEDEASGPTYSVPRLCTAISSMGHDVQLMTLGEPSSLATNGYNHLRYRRDFSFIPALSRIGASVCMLQALRDTQSDILHTHGLWMMPNVYPSTVAKQRKALAILSPRGMLGKEALKFSRRKKRLFWELYQKRAAARLSCIHATSASELEEIRVMGLRTPVCIIPNGIDVSHNPTPNSESSEPFVLSLGRIHPKKGLPNLVEAWKKVNEKHGEWHLKIVGPDECGHRHQLENIIHQKNIKRVRIEEPVYGANKASLMRGAEIFILPTLNENFAMTVAESLAEGTPVISSKGAPWAGLNKTGSGWWVDADTDSLACALDEAMSLSNNSRFAMGQLGRNWMLESFSWSQIGSNMIHVYEWLLGRRDKPDCVVL